MPNEHLDAILSIPAEELPRRSKVRLEIMPNVDALYDHFARSIASEIASRNAAGQPTLLILSSWRSRVADYQAFTSKELEDFVEREGLQVIGYQALRTLMHNRAI